MDFRCGIGYDVHRFKKGRKLILGGVRIPHPFGLIGHSDADVILHAISDAILGACGLRDIGVYFPNNDPQYKNISSRLILKKVFNLAKNKKFRIVNVDCMVIAEKPKINPYNTRMKKCISDILGTKNISIKATSNEGLGFIGKNKGIACFAIVLVKKNG